MGGGEGVEAVAHDGQRGGHRNHLIQQLRTVFRQDFACLAGAVLQGEKLMAAFAQA